MPITQKSQITPGLGDVHVSRPLTNISVAFIQDADGFVADRVFQNIGVDKKTDMYYTFPLGEFTRDQMKVRAPATESQGSGYTLSRDSYYCDVRALHKDIDDQTRANTDNPLSQDREATIFLTEQAMINKERNWVDAYFKTGVWSVEIAGGSTPSTTLDPLHASNNVVNYWNDASSTPIETVRLLKRVVGRRTGRRPNTLTLSRDAYDTLLDHPDIIERLDRGQTPGQPAMGSRDALARLFELDEILVSDAIWNDKDAGETANNQYIMGKHALLSFRPASPGIMTPAAGYQFGWAGFTGASNDGTRMKQFRMENIESDRIEIQSAYDFKLVSADLGAFLHNIVE